MSSKRMLALVVLAFAWGLMAPTQAIAKPVSFGALDVCVSDGGRVWFIQGKRWCCANYQAGPDKGKRYCVTCVHDQTGAETCDEALVTPSRPITPGGIRR